MDMKRLFFGFSFKRVWWAVLLFSLFFAPSAHCEPNDPQQIISHFENEIQGISSQKKDSIKNALLSSYVQEYRNYGKETALDSLETRVNRLLNNKERHTVNIPVNNPVTPIEMNEDSNLSEIEVLQKENQKLTKEIERLKKELTERKPQSAPKNTQNLTSSMISNEVKKTREIADSLAAQMLKTKKEAIITPIYFDSINHSDFFNYIRIIKPEYKSAIDTTQSKRNSFAQKTDNFLFQNKQRRRTVNALAVSQPELIEFYNLSIYDNKAHDIKQARKKIIAVDVDEYKTIPVFEKLTEFLKPRKQSNWSSNGKLNIQFSQYYVTKNWYKGGDPNATLLSLLEYYEDYNNNDKLIWNNGLDVRIGFYNSGIDTLRAFRVNNDVFKITSRLGYQTFFHKKWYYSLYGEFNTCMFTGYAGTNSSEVVTAFFSPTRIFTSLGLDYRYNKNTVVLIAPLAHKLIFLTNDKIDALSVGIASGKSSSSFGYMLQAKTNWQFTREISVNSNFHLFSTYDFKNVEFNWETVGNFTINRYLSTRLSLNMRFDNTPKKPDKTSSKDKDEKPKYEKPKLQMQEQLSFGFYYKF